VVDNQGRVFSALNLKKEERWQKREDKTKGLFMCGKMDGLLEQYLSRQKN